MTRGGWNIGIVTLLHCGWLAACFGFFGCHPRLEKITDALLVLTQRLSYTTNGKGWGV